MIALGDAVLSKFAGLGSSPDYVAGFDDLSVGIMSRIYADGAAFGVASFQQKRHDGRWNVLFCDGHVLLKTQRQLFDLKNPEVRRVWNSDNQPHLEFTDPLGP
ncbi:MAG: H-X9-DG-CTERM domain-containing protein [Limisphaerales bacterium]